MGNMQCPAEDAALLASVARDVCPFPNYNPSPLFVNMLSINSSLHLRDYYTTVQSSLTPKQLEDFTKDLRSTFGREGNVTFGGMGVVALSLAVLFDTLARQVRGDWVSDSGPVPGLFVKDLKGHYPPHVYTVSKYLRLVPHIANNPNRMREETERSFKQLLIDSQSVKENKSQNNDDITKVNIMLGELFLSRLRIHLLHITDSAVVSQIIKSVKAPRKRKGDLDITEDSVFYNLNCDPEAASKNVLAEVQKSNSTQKAFRRCNPSSGYIQRTWLHFSARLVLLDVVYDLHEHIENKRELLKAQREDFDLKFNALRKWAE